MLPLSPRRAARPTAMLAAALFVLPASFAVANGDADSESLDLEEHVLLRARVRRHGFRTIDGSYNNPWMPSMGSLDTQLRRKFESDYADGISELAGPDRPSAREVSNEVADQIGSTVNVYGASDYLWQWGQFVDHDIDLTPGASPAEPANIDVPEDDPYFDVAEIHFNRSVYDLDTSDTTPRQQINQITTWIDASNVYGSDEFRASVLRANDGTGMLATSDGDLMPFNTLGLPNANDVGAPAESLFLGGDVRANEQTALTAMHTLFVREHNRLAKRIKQWRPHWAGEKIYQYARRIVGAQMQVITYREFLPALLGEDALRPYRGYRFWKDASITNVFSTASYRFGHSALSPTLLRVDADGNESDFGNLPLRDAFFDPTNITDEGGIDEILRGLAAQKCQKVDEQVVDDVRNFLFGQPGAGGFDLASLNMQRGRDHGLPSYNAVREALHMDPAEDFSDISSDPAVQAKLDAAYESVDDVDLWIGALSEDPVEESHLGPVNQKLVAQQFQALRDGDRFWYQRIFSRRAVRHLEKTRLSDIIRRNTGIGDELPDNVFKAAVP